MGIFDSIKSAIFGEATAEAPKVETALNASDMASPMAASMDTDTDEESLHDKTADAEMDATDEEVAEDHVQGEDDVVADTPAAVPAMTIDVGAILDAAVAKSGQDLDWRKSIVDLMKALDLDSSLENRKELAGELDYTGDMGDSATMNVWLHKALMKTLAEHGGTVPAELAD